MFIAVARASRAFPLGVSSAGLQSTRGSGAMLSSVNLIMLGRSV